MGSCVSHCSRQDVVHQQTGRLSDVANAIEISGSSLLQKTLAGFSADIKEFSTDANGKRNKDLPSSVKLLIPQPNEVRDQINAEIHALREQLIRSQVLFTYLLKNTSLDNAKSPDDKKQLCTLLEGGNLGDVMFQCKSYDGQILGRLYNRSNRSSSSYTSHRSTPMHCGYTSLSCPTLPVDYPAVTKSTQTEPFSKDTLYMNTKSSRILQTDSNLFLNKSLPAYCSPPSTPCETIPETFLLSDICEVHREPEDHTFPRHRTKSFLSAIKEGNSRLINAVRDKGLSSNGKSCDTLTTFKKFDTPYYISQEQLNSLQMYEIEGKNIMEESKDNIFPRKLSILLEEDYEDIAGNPFSISTPQPFMNRKKKVPIFFNVNTQTDLSMSLSSICSQNNSLSLTKPSDLSIKETCIPRCGYTIVSQAVQKKTAYSIELPQKLILRYPPPYMKRILKCHCFASHNNSLKEISQLRHHICKWATVSESLPSKIENMHSLTADSQIYSKLQTRHLSLEKQESFSSCEHSLYPDSRMSSVTDCSGWITRSEVELNLRPEPPSYQQSLLASHWNQSTRNSRENNANESKSLDASTNSVRNPDVTDSAESNAKVVDIKNEYKNSKYLQRSLRRGSGAGSPNSQLSIPRYPAFDFSEQEDVQSMFPSPSEPEANHNIKAEPVPSSENSEDSIGLDLTKNTLNLKNTNQPKRGTNKSKTLMPEFMENSETESTKGSFECEALDMPASLESASLSVPDIAFPSLPNTFLAKLGVHKDSPHIVDAFDEQDLESKFIALSLAFKTDAATLNKRLELHKRQRDMAEKNVENEFKTMREHLNALNLRATTSDMRDLISKIQNHLDIAQQATSRVSGRSETFGAVQQEERVSRAFEVLVLYVDHLKRLFDKEHRELEETKRMLTDTKSIRKENIIDGISEDQKKYSKTFGLPVGSIKSLRKPIVQISES